MRLYALRDEAGDGSDLAYLECYERPRRFYFELPPDADPWEFPFILHEHAQRKTWTVGAMWSERWVQSRLVPPERQNLGEVLRVNHLDSYDELRLIELTAGRCSQDGCYLVPIAIGTAPRWYRERVSQRLADVFALDQARLAITLRDGSLLACRMAELLANRREFQRVMTDESIFARVACEPGGHGAQWGEKLAVPVSELRGIGTSLIPSASDLRRIIAQATCDTSEVADILGCTRQNVSDLVRRGKLVPVKTAPRGPLFWRADVLKRAW